MARCRLVALVLLLLALPAARPGGERHAAGPPLSAVAEAGCSLRLNEILPEPRNIDWNGDGLVSSPSDEWIEIYNTGVAPCDLTGWRLDTGAGTHAFHLTGTIGPGQYRVYFGSTTGLQLPNSMGTVRLVSPDNMPDVCSYQRGEPDGSFSRVDKGTWAPPQFCAPSPGRANCTSPPATPTPTPTPTSTPRPTQYVPATPTPTATPTPVQSRLAVCLPLIVGPAQDPGVDADLDSQAPARD